MRITVKTGIIAAFAWIGIKMIMHSFGTYVIAPAVLLNILGLLLAIAIVEKDTGNTLFFNESLHLKDGGEQQKIASDLLNLAEIVAKSKSSVISSKRLSLFDYLSAYSDAVFHFAEDKTLNLSVYLIGLVSVKKAPFYERLNDKHETIFSLFAQQFLSILTNFYQNKKIQDQIVKISSSEIELKKLS